MELKKQCSICKKEFTPCNSCDKLSIFFNDIAYQWRKVVCCIDHFYYHLPIINYSRGQIQKNEARKQLLDCIDKYGEVDFNDNVLKIVEDILSYDDEDNTDTIKETEEINIESSKSFINTKKKRKR